MFHESASESEQVMRARLLSLKRCNRNEPPGNNLAYPIQQSVRRKPALTRELHYIRSRERYVDRAYVLRSVFELGAISGALFGLNFGLLLASTCEGSLAFFAVAALLGSASGIAIATPVCRCFLERRRGDLFC